MKTIPREQAFATILTPLSACGAEVAVLTVCAPCNKVAVGPVASANCKSCDATPQAESFDLSDITEAAVGMANFLDSCLDPSEVANGKV